MSCIDAAGYENEGLSVAERLIAMSENQPFAIRDHRLDRAKLLAAMGKAPEAESIYREIMRSARRDLADAPMGAFAS